MNKIVFAISSKIFKYTFYDWDSLIENIEETFPFLNHTVESCECGRCKKIIKFYNKKSKNENAIFILNKLPWNRFYITFYNKSDKCKRCNQTECINKRLIIYKKKPKFVNGKLDDYVIGFICKYII